MPVNPQYLPDSYNGPPTSQPMEPYVGPRPFRGNTPTSQPMEPYVGPRPFRGNTPTSQPMEPYVGPRPFRGNIEDQSRFFGRDSEANEIVSLITSHRLVLIYAQSGSGKTSIMNAKVAPILENYGFDILPMVRIQITSEHTTIVSSKINGSDKSQVGNQYIYNALQSLRPDLDSQLILDLSLFEFLDEYFQNQKGRDGRILPQVLIFDQLEELFSLYPDNWIKQQEEFFQEVSDSLENNPLLRIVFIIREDYLAQLRSVQKRISRKTKAKL